MKCKKCGHANKPGVKFCDTCGASMVGGVCPDCGHKNRADAKFCDKCGANIKGAVKQSGLPKETSKKPGLSPVLKITIGAIGLITFVGGALRMLQYSNFSLPNFLSGAESSSEEESNFTKVAYSTNPATIVEEGTPIAMVSDWAANTEEQVQDFIDNAEQEVVINGTTIIAKITYGEISADEETGGFTSQFTVEIGNLPAGTNTIITTISWKQEITNGKESFGPGTDNEKVKKEARIIVGKPSNVQNAGGDNAKAAQAGDTIECPDLTEITVGEVDWFDGNPYIEIRNELGWGGKYKKIPGDPSYFAWEEGSQKSDFFECDVDPDDDKLMVCASGDIILPSEVQLHLTYPWGGSPDDNCRFDVHNINVVEKCPPVEEFSTGKLDWDKGMAILEVYNTLGWEPYEEDPEFPSFLTVHKEPSTELGCEVDPENDTIMVCSGPGTIKTGNVGLDLTFPWGGDSCRFWQEDIEIIDLCPTGSFFCIFINDCCPDGNKCDQQGGCYSDAPPAPSSDDDHYH